MKLVDPLKITGKLVSILKSRVHVCILLERDYSFHQMAKALVATNPKR